MRPTRNFNEAGDSIPVTEIKVEPCSVVQVKLKATDGYNALQLGFDIQNLKQVNKPRLGHLKKLMSGTKFLPRFLKEVRLQEGDSIDFKPGDQIEVDQVFQTGDRIKVTAVSKAKGFQGVVKRHGFAGGPRTHGQSDRERAPGSIGQSTTPGRVYKGKRMAGRTGGNTVTVSGLKVVSFDKEKKILKIKGLIPGNKNTPVFIQKQQ